jgi:hypothetical protein
MPAPQSCIQLTGLFTLFDAFRDRPFHAQRCASPTAAGEAGRAQKEHSSSPKLPSGKRGRRLGAGALVAEVIISVECA